MQRRDRFSGNHAWAKLARLKACDTSYTAFFIVHHLHHPLLSLVLAQSLLNGLDHIGVNTLFGGNDSLVALQCASNGKVKRLAVHVRNDSTGLLNEKRSGGVVLENKIRISGRPTFPACWNVSLAYPNLLLVGLGNWETKVDVTVTAGDRAVLGLAMREYVSFRLLDAILRASSPLKLNNAHLRVHASARLGDAQDGGDASVRSVVAVTGLHRFAEGGIREGGEGRHADGGESGGGERAL